MEESDEPTLVGSASDKKYAAIRWVDKYGKYIIHSSTHTSISATSSGDENWEKEFSFLVPHEEQEAPIGVQNYLRDSPLPYQKNNSHILYPIDSIYPHMHWIGKYITQMETKGCASLAHIGKSFLCVCSKFIDAY